MLLLLSPHSALRCVCMETTARTKRKTRAMFSPYILGATAIRVNVRKKNAQSAHPRPVIGGRMSSPPAKIIAPRPHSLVIAIFLSGLDRGRGLLARNSCERMRTKSKTDLSAGKNVRTRLSIYAPGSEAPAARDGCHAHLSTVMSSCAHGLAVIPKAVYKRRRG